MLEKLERRSVVLGGTARFAVRRRWWVLAAALVFAALAGAFGGTVSEKLVNGGYTPSASPAAEADRRLAEKFSAGEPSLVLVLSAEGGIDQPDALQAGTRLTTEIDADDRVQSVTSFFTTGLPDLRSSDGTRALVLVKLKGDERQVQATTAEVVPKWTDSAKPLEIDVTGRAQVNAEIAKQSEDDLIKAELIGAPITLIILVLAFGSLLSSVLPVVVGMLAVAATTAVLSVLSEVTDVSIFALNLTTALGFGLAVDYSLFIVARFREELRAGREVPDAVVRSVVTAGRTVIFSAVTVALSLSALLIFPMFFLRSLAYAAISVVAVAAMSSVTVLPAVLALLGNRVLGRARKREPKPEGRWWGRVAHAVMRRPVLAALPVLVLLALAAVPFLDVRFGMADHRVLPASAPSHRTAVEITEDFDRSIGDAMPVLVDTADQSTVDDLVKRASRLPGAESVEGPTGVYRAGELVQPPTPASAAMVADGSAWLRVWPAQGPYDEASQELARSVRALDSRVHVAGPSAVLVDTKDVLSERLPWAFGAIAVFTFILLFLFTGGLLVPLKALVLNLFSLSASFGAAVYVFQEGHLSWLVGDFTSTGYLETTIPVLVFCIAFGLSMDYEVFLLSRIREDYVATGNNTHAVAQGLQRTGRVFTAAALVIASVLAVLATSGVSLLKLLGVTMALAVLVDAWLIRGVLAPAFMKLAGRANWWAPKPLAALHRRLGLKE
ncbi:MMPL family transporter [Saccharothrix variisporea]|uniref:RND superfamily putative drug exporter n=1 Tax=Saccharothrix variisporea TaxID=543527 RepID=A0A495XNT2_9PSEU|nr:MMPL family transporter [Saccharothrix variisporea]RKT74564.1 RND superfamily putative drug exporter [Saccharothrix variisporea]